MGIETVISTGVGTGVGTVRKSRMPRWGLKLWPSRVSCCGYVVRKSRMPRWGLKLGLPAEEFVLTER